MTEYRDAAPADGPALSAMAQAAWLATFGAHYSAADRNAYLAHAYGPDGDLFRHLADPAFRYRIAVEDKTILGFAKLNAPWIPDAEPGAMQLSQIYVVADRHGTGVGAALMDWAADAARAAGAPALLLTVWEHNPRGIAFYRKRGFVHVCDYAYPVGAQIDRDLVMRLAL